MTERCPGHKKLFLRITVDMELQRLRTMKFNLSRVWHSVFCGKVWLLVSSYSYCVNSLLNRSWLFIELIKLKKNSSLSLLFGEEGL